jgi:2-dehydro-3-deoxyglucarate aldolase
MTLREPPLPNEFRRALLEHKTLIGCWCSLASPISTEVMGYAGFDWLLIDGEHAPNELSSVVLQLMALKDSTSAAMVRPQWAEPIIIKRLLDAGVYNFLMPFIETAEEARAAVRATRYPPQGIRGVAVAHRSNRYGYCPDYFARINDNISVVVQIESRSGVEQAAAIAAVDGVDALFIGPNDLAAAYGRLGEPSHPDVQAAMKHIVESARAHGKASGILAPEQADAKRYLEWGMTLVAVGADVGLLRQGSHALRTAFKP